MNDKKSKDAPEDGDQTSQDGGTEEKPQNVKLAEAFGLLGIRVSERNEVASGIAKAMDFDGPALIDFRVEQEENVYPFIPSGMSVADIIEGPRAETVKK